MTLFIPEYQDQPAPRELIDMGSFNHSYLQTRIGSLLDRYDAYIPFTELTLDVSSAPFDEVGIRPQKAMEPDVCLYPYRTLNFRTDTLRMTEMPLLAVEIVSPVQGMLEIMDKFRVYFALGVKSCWLVLPTIQSVTVFTSPDDSTTHDSGDLVDPNLNITLPIHAIFRRPRKN